MEHLPELIQDWLRSVMDKLTDGELRFYQREYRPKGSVHRWFLYREGYPCWLVTVVEDGKGDWIIGSKSIERDAIIREDEDAARDHQT